MDKILGSFKIKRSLCDEFWDGADGEGADEVRLKPEIRTKLMQIADAFIDSFNIEGLEIEDILFLGSLAGYNWSKFSDVDIHVVIDKESIEGSPELVSEFFDAKKRVFNESHDITVKGYATELYVQDVNEENQSLGKYSVLYNEWVQFPKAEKGSVDKSAIIKKVKEFVRQQKAINAIADGDAKLKKIEALQDKIQKYRKTGVNGEGEFSTENLVFKYLRRSGFMEDLFQLKFDVMDRVLSLQESKF
jgi:predicted nucleotidyltransferase